VTWKHDLQWRVLNPLLVQDARFRGQGDSMIIDADAHVVETEHTLDYLDASQKKFRPQLFQSTDNPNAQYWFLDGKPIGFRAPTLTEQELIALSKQTGRDLKTAAEARELRDVELRLAHMDKLGIDVQVLFNTMWIARVADRAEAEIALCASWNRWMADVWKQGKNRLRWSCVVPAMTISEALQQMRVARDNGAIAVSLRPFENDRHLVDPYFYPVYEEATRLNMAVAIHIANGSPQLLDQFKPRYDKMGGFAQFRIPTVITCLSIMMSDLPNLFPDLRWAFVEASAQWVPWVVKEAKRRSGTSGFPDNPLKQFKIFVTTETNDDFDFVLKYAGEDNLVIGTDYGHTDASSEVDAIEIFRKNAAIAEPIKKKILEDNPRALYAI
jgi:predicted TIM-barrel fold metal-dependent hydrolase